MHPSLISLSVSPICKDWCWSWNSHTLTTSCEELTHWKRPWCWEGLGAGGEGDDRGWDGWMASPTRWTWVWVNSGSWWWTGRPGMLWFMGSQRVGHDWATELNWTEALFCMEQNQSGSRDCLGEGTKDIKRETGWRPLLQGLVHFQECIVCCLFNKSCLLELSWSVISILCSDKTRTEEEEMIQQIDTGLTCELKN